MFSHETLNDQGRTASAEVGRRIRNSSSQNYQSPKRSLRDEVESDEDVHEAEPHDDRLDTDEEQELEYVLKGTVEVSDSEAVHDDEGTDAPDQPSVAADESNAEGEHSDAAEAPVSGNDESNSSADEESPSDVKEEFPDADGEGGVDKVNCDAEPEVATVEAESSREASNSDSKPKDKVVDKSSTEEV